MKLLEEDLHSRPTVTYEKRADLLCELLGVRVSKSTICPMVGHLGYTTQKRSLGATQRDEWLRGAAWRVSVARTIDPQRRLVFVDEMGTNISLFVRCMPML
jgi:hypothetical protein